MDIFTLALSTLLPVLFCLVSPTALDAMQGNALLPAQTEAPTATITTTVAALEPLTVTIAAGGFTLSEVIEQLYDERLSTPASSVTTVSQPQRAATTCLVTNSADAGPGTLRTCLVNATAGDLIQFDSAQFPPTTPMSITLATPLSIITVDNLLIDGSNAGVVLLGDQLSVGDGLVISGTTNVVVRGLQIKRFPGSGIVLKGGATNSVIGGDRGVGAAPLGQGNLLSENDKSGVQIEDAASRDNLVIGNYIGVDVSGTQAAGNFVGVSILSAVSNIIGSGVEGQGNVISGNLTNGVLVHGASDNQILGNTIGTDHSGTLPLGNAENGISLYEEARNNTIGGLGTGEGNLISDHKRQAILVAFNSDHNMVIGNFIGTDRSGTQSIGNRIGIILNQSAHTIIGGIQPGARNLISGNRRADAPLYGYGIHLTGGATENQILGNYIGVAADGETALPNKDGIVVSDGHHNIIGGTAAGSGNLLSGNLETGIYVDGMTAVGNQVLGNFIGVDHTGAQRLGNYSGVAIIGEANQNIVGGSSSGTRNIISGNVIGINLQGTGTVENQVLGNFIGTDITGTSPISNATGILIGFSATRNVIGGSDTGERNLISGNNFGVQIQDSNLITGTLNNQIIGNFIGVDVSGTSALGNREGIYILDSDYNRIGGTNPGEGNLLSGNSSGGVTISGGRARYNRIIGNIVGPEYTGSETIKVQPIVEEQNELQLAGITLVSGAANNLVGGVLPEERNLISGNATGISITNAKHNRVWGNYIGTNFAGTVALPNGFGINFASQGVDIELGATENQIGGSEPGAGNLISGNSAFGIVISQDGTDKNQILGNIIGTDISGSKPLGNGSVGIIVGAGATENIIGGTTSDAGNLISGNGFAGVAILHEKTANNRLLGNAIGTDITQLLPIPNGNGVLVIDGADNNLIGGETPDMGNLVSGNLYDGIILSGKQTLRNEIANNQIGVAGDGLTPLGNGGAGIVLTDTTKLNIIGISNTIAYNSGAGIYLATEEKSSNQITRNQIHDNGTGEIVWATPAGAVRPDFTLQYYQPTTGGITGTTCAGCTVEFFANPTPTDAGTIYLGRITAGSDGRFTINFGGPAPMPHLAATVTKPDRTTFGFYLLQQSQWWLPMIAR